MISRKLGNAIFAVISLPMLCFARSGSTADEQRLLSTFISYTELRIHSVQQCLDVIASTIEVKSGKWEDIKHILSHYQNSDAGMVAWFVQPDGTYYTVDQGLMDATLSDRRYFPELMAGRKICGALVVSKSTGKRSAIIAVPVFVDGKVVGAVGASVFLDVLSEQVRTMLVLPEDAGFFALAPDGLTALHPQKDGHFLDPREMGSDSLVAAANEMLSMPEGEASYEFDLIAKRAVFRTSPLTQWTFAITIHSPDGSANGPDDSGK